MHLAATWTAYPVRKDTIDKNGRQVDAEQGHLHLERPTNRLVRMEARAEHAVEKNPHYWGDTRPDTITWTLYDGRRDEVGLAYESGRDRPRRPCRRLSRARKADATLSKEIKKFDGRARVDHSRHTTRR